MNGERPKLPEDPDTRTVLALMSQAVAAIALDGGVSSFVVIVHTNRGKDGGKRIAGVKLTDTTDFTVMRGLLAQVDDMVADDERERRKADGRPSGLVDPSGSSIE